MWRVCHAQIEGMTKPREVVFSAPQLVRARFLLSLSYLQSSSLRLFDSINRDVCVRAHACWFCLVSADLLVRIIYRECAILPGI